VWEGACTTPPRRVQAAVLALGAPIIVFVLQRSQVLSAQEQQREWTQFVRAQAAAGASGGTAEGGALAAAAADTVVDTRSVLDP
jgi:hypothetical protein